MNASTLLRALVASACLLATPVALAGPDSPKNWLDTRLSTSERETLFETVGYAPPAMPDGVRFIGEKPWAFADLRGKVVVVQSWTRETMAGRSAVKRIEALLESAFGDRDDLVVVNLHTPEGAEGVDMYLERRPPTGRTIVDATGRLCDELGVWKRPSSLVIDRNGAIRHAALRYTGVRDAVKELLEEPAPAEDAPAPPPLPPRDARDGGAPAKPAGAGTGDYPAITGTISNARDLRGKDAPDFHVQEWISDTPNLDGKVLVIDFWATWCGPCVASIPHMNELADEFRDSVVVVGISAEDANTVRNFYRRRGDMDYGVAIDPGRRMTNAVRNRGIPHGLVVSPDGIVRWQGHPARLDEDTLRQIVEASGAGGGGGSGGGGPRWVTE